MRPVPDLTTLRNKVVEIQRGYVGEGRYNAPEQITKFLEVEGLSFADPSGKPYAFCISGLCFAWMKALADLMDIPFTADNIVAVLKAQVKPILAEHFFTPSALCVDVIHDAMRRGHWLPIAEAMANGTRIPAGTPVFYEFFPGDHHAETVIVDVIVKEGGAFETVGDNTTLDGHTGMIAEKTRDYGDVIGFIVFPGVR